MRTSKKSYHTAKHRGQYRLHLRRAQVDLECRLEEMMIRADYASAKAKVFAMFDNTDHKETVQ